MQRSSGQSTGVDFILIGGGGDDRTDFGAALSEAHPLPDRPGDNATPDVAYTHAVRSVADDLREELQDEVLRLPFEERIALILRLGERGLEMFRQANGLDRETAIRELQRQRQAGRTPSKCMSELIG